ncbi:MAG TPA: DUF6492 family protein [Aeromicrobium sp.]|nr:DUF6492 family protein [Aeromicrobium sp.]
MQFGPQPITFVVVVFEAELDLLLLQARSFSRHCDPNLVGQILIFDQSKPAMSAKWQRRIAKAFGSLADRVRILAAQGGTDGWTQQQILKLAAAGEVQSDYYVALDAKTHLTGPLSRPVLFAEDGRAHLRRYSYLGHPMEARVRTTLNWLGLDPKLIDSDLPATTTPFVFVTAETKALVKSVSDETGKPFAEAFRDEGLIEFPLYSLWLKKQGRLDSLYDHEPIECSTVWPRFTTAPQLREVLVRADPEPVFAAVHRSAVARLSAPAMIFLARWWKKQGLFEHTSSALWFLTRMRIRISIWRLRRIKPGSDG